MNRFITTQDARVETLPGKVHFWISEPGTTETKDLVVVRAHFAVGVSHPFHYHPGKEEVITIIRGLAEQWIGEEKRILGPGDSVYIPKDVPHATFNIGQEMLDFIAIITPMSAGGPITVDIAEQEPWAGIMKQREGAMA